MAVSKQPKKSQISVILEIELASPYKQSLSVLCDFCSLRHSHLVEA